MGNHETDLCCGPGYASPQEAMKAEQEKILYTVGLYGGTGTQAPDYLATGTVGPAKKEPREGTARLQIKPGEASHLTIIHAHTEELLPSLPLVLDSPSERHTLF